MKDRICEVCKEWYTPIRYNQKICGKDKCKKERQRLAVQSYRKSFPADYSCKKDEGLEKPKPKKKLASPASKRWASMSWKELTMELMYYKMSYPESQVRAEKNALPEDFGKKRKDVRG